MRAHPLSGILKFLGFAGSLLALDQSQPSLCQAKPNHTVFSRDRSHRLFFCVFRLLAVVLVSVTHREPSSVAGRGNKLSLGRIFVDLMG